MQLWQDGLIAMLAAIGLASLMWAVVRMAMFPSPETRRPVTAVVPASGDGAELEAQIRFLVQLRREQGVFIRIVVVDCGLSDEGRHTASLLASSNRCVEFCRKEDIGTYIP